MDLRRLFDSVAPGTIGIEEEVLLLDPSTLAPAPLAGEVLARAAGDARIKEELPAAQVELVTRPCASVDEALRELAGARAALARACDGLCRPAAAALHPTARGSMALTPGSRYARTDELHRGAARRQLMGALQVHVAVGGAARTLAVYNALRGRLPELAALAAAAPFLEGEDTGLASARPLVAQLLPRQGVPPALSSWEALEDELRWGLEATTLVDPARWWWELRPHLEHGTLEVRVPDVQPTLARTAVVARACAAAVAQLAAAFDAGEPLGPVAPSWRIAENRWTALRDGLHAQLADLETGAPYPVRERLAELLPDVPERTAADELREVGVDGAAGWLTEAFLHPVLPS